ncbi:hypothetical protein LTR37_008983 [Vermiconidia calcicola]|uniref:Uncharacterized protein n=1 Tax=Vermiconidia calcicola TaxID=1690605 RepID=A0ACC3NC04_9PEZI|nr:hypothetical protein LTR37_008983 [Vermiconidia calcicola]
MVELAFYNHVPSALVDRVLAKFTGWQPTTACLIFTSSTGKCSCVEYAPSIIYYAVGRILRRLCHAHLYINQPGSLLMATLDLIAVSRCRTHRRMLFKPLIKAQFFDVCNLLHSLRAVYDSWTPVDAYAAREMIGVDEEAYESELMRFLPKETNMPQLTQELCQGMAACMDGGMVQHFPDITGLVDSQNAQSQQRPVVDRSASSRIIGKKRSLELGPTENFDFNNCFNDEAPRLKHRRIDSAVDLITPDPTICPTPNIAGPSNHMSSFASWETTGFTATTTPIPPPASELMFEGLFDETLQNMPGEVDHTTSPATAACTSDFAIFTNHHSTVPTPAYDHTTVGTIGPNDATLSETGNNHSSVSTDLTASIAGSSDTDTSTETGDHTAVTTLDPLPSSAFDDPIDWHPAFDNLIDLHRFDTSELT